MCGTVCAWIFRLFLASRRDQRVVCSRGTGTVPTSKFYLLNKIIFVLTARSLVIIALQLIFISINNIIAIILINKLALLDNWNIIFIFNWAILMRFWAI